MRNKKTRFEMFSDTPNEPYLVIVRDKNSGKIKTFRHEFETTRDYVYNELMTLNDPSLEIYKHEEEENG